LILGCEVFGVFEEQCDGEVRGAWQVPWD
jgi:hypothetical protein